MKPAPNIAIQLIAARRDPIEDEMELTFRGVLSYTHYAAAVPELSKGRETKRHRVVIAGGGPTGLALALGLANAAWPVWCWNLTIRCVQAAGPEPSRAVRWKSWNNWASLMK